MKKFLLMPVFAVMALFSNAQTANTYTDDLEVSVNFAEPTVQNADVSVEYLDNGKCNLSLKNFIFGSGETAQYVGNIEINDVTVEDNDSYKNLGFNGVITITAGDETIASADKWIGPGLGELPLNLVGKVNDNKLYVKVTINIPLQRQFISVVYGNEDFDTETTTSKVYTDDLIVTINETSTPAQKADINVDFLPDNKCNLSLKNFALGSGDEVIYVGNITLNDIQLTDNDGYKTFEVEQVITITPGDESIAPADSWFGPMLGEVPVKMTGKVNDEKLYCLIDIDMMSTLGQIIKVTFGSDITTSVASVNTDVNAKVNVYSLSGVLLRSNVESANALNGLAKGIYIVNGKKVVNK